jgi:serine O-acetyltransferase
MSILEDLGADFRRHGSSAKNLAFWALATYRFGNWANTLPKPLKWTGGKLYGAMSFCVEITSGIWLNREARIGCDFHLVHSGNIKIHPNVIIGDRVGIMQDVTIGTGEDPVGTPVIGDDVFIGAGAKILGPVKVGDRARVAANSLVITDVPSDTTAIGVPAKILRYTGRTTQSPTSAGAPSRTASTPTPSQEAALVGPHARHLRSVRTPTASPSSRTAALSTSVPEGAPPSKP